MFRIFLTVLAIILLNSCTSAPKKVPPRPAKEADLQLLKSAKKDIISNRTSRAKMKLEKLLAGDPSSEIIDDAHIELGDIYYSEEDYQKAYQNYVAVVQSKIFSPIEAEASYKAARALVKMGRFDEAIAVTDSLLRYNKVSTQSVLNIYKLRFFCIQSTGRPMDAIKTLLTLADTESDAKRKGSYRLKAIDFVESQLDEKDLNEVAYNSDYKELQGTPFRLGLLDFENKNFSDSRSRLSRVSSVMPDTENI
ncbi:MAG: tetratricopeptide repeat protein [Bdellovibrionales bacterium]